MITSAPLTRTLSRRVVAARTRWNEDRYVDGPGGGGWAFASFDRPLLGTHTVGYDDGETRSYTVCTESEPEEFLKVGDVVDRVIELVPAIPPAIDSSDIPF
jgi:hypothetical protein